MTACELGIEYALGVRYFSGAAAVFSQGVAPAERICSRSYADTGDIPVPQPCDALLLAVCDYLAYSAAVGEETVQKIIREAAH